MLGMMGMLPGEHQATPKSASNLASGEMGWILKTLTVLGHKFLDGFLAANANAAIAIAGGLLLLLLSVRAPGHSHSWGLYGLGHFSGRTDFPHTHTNTHPYTYNPENWVVAGRLGGQYT